MARNVIKKINKIEIEAQAKYDKNSDELAIPSFVVGMGEVKSPIAKLFDDLAKITEKVKGLNLIDDGFSESGVVRPDMAQDDLQENIDNAVKKHDYILAGKCQQLQKDIDHRKPEYMTVSLKKNGLYHVNYTTFKDVVNTASALLTSIATPVKN